MTKHETDTLDIQKKSLWITWEKQRRSQVLSSQFKSSFHEIILTKRGIIRYVYLCFYTLKLILKEKPDILYVQSPSIVLSALAALYRKLFKNIILIVDRHSNFYRISSHYSVDFTLQMLGNFALRNADFTIVTNETLRKIVEDRKGAGVVLQDKIPNLISNSTYKLCGKFNLLYPCSFSVDEPIINVLNAVEKISEDIHVYISGNYSKYFPINVTKLPNNIHLIGYLTDQEYINYMFSVNCVLALTTWENTLLCCAYEAVSMLKPLILSNKFELCNYFYKGIVKCDNSSDGIAKAIINMTLSYEQKYKQIVELKKELLIAWAQRFDEVEKAILQRIDEK